MQVSFYKSANHLPLKVCSLRRERGQKGAGLAPATHVSYLWSLRHALAQFSAGNFFLNLFNIRFIL